MMMVMRMMRMMRMKMMIRMRMRMMRTRRTRMMMRLISLKDEEELWREVERFPAVKETPPLF